MEKIHLSESSVFFDDKELKFPASYEDMISVFGEPDRVYTQKVGMEKTVYIYDELGVSFDCSKDSLKRLKSLKAYLDDEHCIIYFKICFRDKSKVHAFCESDTPTGLCEAKITHTMQVGDETKSLPLSFLFDRAKAGNFSVIAWSEDDVRGKYKGSTDSPQWNCTFSFTPPEPEHFVQSYKIKKCKEEVLEFTDINFKLAVVQQLMYEKKLLEPIFDIYRFAELYDGSPIDTESEKIIKPALNWFKKLPVPKRLAAEIETLCSDGGDEVYMNLIPQWDGKDDVFDIKSITPDEIKQFPNLKSVSIFADGEVLEVFKSCGIQVEK